MRGGFRVSRRRLSDVGDPCVFQTGGGVAYVTRRAAVFVLALPSASALAADDEVPPCPAVQTALCDDLGDQLQEGRRQVADTSGSGGAEVGSALFNVKLQGGGRQFTQSVTLSPDTLDHLARALELCRTAVRSTDPYPTQLFWDEVARSGDMRCLADASSVPAVSAPAHHHSIVLPGILLALAGSAAGVGTWAVTLGEQPPPQPSVVPLKIGNAAGWTVAVAGVGLAGVGLVGGAGGTGHQVDAAARIRVGGVF